MLLWDSWQITCWPGPVVNRPIFLAEEGKPKNQEQILQILAVVKNMLQNPTTAKNAANCWMFLRELLLFVLYQCACWPVGSYFIQHSSWRGGNICRNVDFIEHQYYRFWFFSLYSNIEIISPDRLDCNVKYIVVYIMW